MEKLHKIYVSNGDIRGIIKACFNEEYNNMNYFYYDSLVDNAVKNSDNSTFFKIENNYGTLVGYFSIKNGVLIDSHIRKTFRNSSYISAINVLQNEEKLLKTNASLSFSRNKILN